MQRVAWFVAAILIMINGYLLLDFFFSEVKGLLVGLIVCTVTAAYVAFIVYLLQYGGVLSSAWISLISSKFSRSHY